MATPRLASPAAVLLCLCVALAPAEAAARLVGAIEEPRAGGDCTGVGNIRGWVYSTGGAELRQPFRVKIDGAPSIEVPCCASRADVARLRPDAPERTGFAGVFNFQLLPPGTHAIEIEVTSQDGESLSLRSSCVSRRLGAATRLSNLDLDNGGEGYCESDLDDPTLICCEGVRTEGPAGPQICRNVCYRWDTARQGLVLAAGAVLPQPLCRDAD